MRGSEENRIGVFETVSFLKADRAGTTLVELTVTVVLLILFLGCTGVTISKGYEIYLKIQGLSESAQVSDMILDKIASELEGALENSSDTITILEDGHRIDFTNANGSKVCITAQGGVMDITYLATSVYGEMHWKFDDAGYFGQKIEELRFEYLIPGGNVIRAEVFLQGDYGQYRNVRCIRCYNF